VSSKQKLLRVAILGASGYTGSELVRLLSLHSKVNISVLTSERSAGKSLDQIFPHLDSDSLPNLISKNKVNYDDIDFVFSALPHGESQEVIAGLPDHLKVVDLSADFRIRDINVYEQVYGLTHKSPEIQQEAIYGLSELAKEKIQSARVVANPGCYPTSVLLPLIPLIIQDLIETNDIVIDSKSGVSGAGRSLNEASLFVEVSGGIHAYGVASHRHAPEIDQELSLVSGKNITVSFTPHLIPMKRGILSTIYVKRRKRDNDFIIKSLSDYFSNQPFVKILNSSRVPHTRHVVGSNNCIIGAVDDRSANRTIICSVIDNLIKGASGQAVQNMNLMCGFEETEGLTSLAIFP